MYIGNPNNESAERPSHAVLPPTPTFRPLKILVHGLNFPPDLIGIAKYSGEMVSWLAARGHQLRVVTAPPYYPAWRLAPADRGLRYRTDRFEAAVPVRRCPIWVPTRPSGLKRLLHLASFALSSTPALLVDALRFRPDVIWTVAPALAAVPGTLLAGRLSGAACWLHVQDLEVDAAFRLGLLRSPRLHRGALAVEGWLMRRFQRISSVAPAMVAAIAAKGCPDVSLVRNWVDTGRIVPLERPSPFRDALGIPADAIVGLYTGVFAAKQGMELVIAAARRLSDRSSADGRPLYFVLAGDGAEKAAIVAAAAGLERVRFLPLQPVERLNDLLGLADIHLLPQRAGADDLMLPSKLTGMLASGRPVLAAAVADRALAGEVAGCGLVVPPEDLDAFCAGLLTLADDPVQRRVLGLAARERALSVWRRDAILEQFERQLLALADGCPA